MPSSVPALRTVFDDALTPADVPVEELVLEQAPFLRMLRIERKRTERSGRPFVLMLLETETLFSRARAGAFEKFANILARTTRETDFKGWYKAGSTFGVIFTEIDATRGAAVTRALAARVTDALGAVLPVEEVSQVRLSFHFYPEDPAGRDGDGSSNPALYPDVAAGEERRQTSRLLKRSLDVGLSLAGLCLLLPLLLAIAAAIQSTSSGPVLFRQQRVGLGGRRFTFLKFRSMRASNDESVHREYMRSFIAGGEGAAALEGAPVYKITNDARVTRVGGWLRRTSLDELPQLINVLRGEMSLVGPRPAIPYEVEAYAPWHRRRVLTVKPGITGLWQVSGRSRVRFDDMVRLDMRYAESWNLWLDLRILLRTPLAVWMGSGAY